MNVNQVMHEIRDLKKELMTIGINASIWEKALQDQCDLISQYESALRRIGHGPEDCETDQMFCERCSDTARAALIV